MGLGDVTMKLKWSSFICLAAICSVGSPPPTLALEVGDQAPTFSGQSTQGDIHLVDYAGKKNVVLALYFAIFTPV
jgi:hypothetical protein